ncbi:MAG: hypothetical protein K8R76_11390 [Candidatus Aegiribacteria sp.]|nr:hypothetical protein [Candidatus Aegiribacteria sp.]
MKIPDGFVIKGGAYAMDGGSIALELKDPEGDKHDIVLWQHMFTEPIDPDKIPGRLYFDKILIPVRSSMESQILAALRQARLGKANLKSDRAEEKLDLNPGVIIGDDIKEYMSKIDESPNAALAHLVRQLIEYVESADYVELARMLN